MTPDYFDMLRALLAANAEFLLVGAHARAVHGTPRATGDLDIWVHRSATNAEKVYRALTAIQFRLEQLGLDQKALVGVIGTRSRVYEVMKGERPLTLKMIRRLVATFGIPAEVLIQEPSGRGAA